ncbi:PepSY domain-containing protein [Oceanobacillus kapialis]|uniref:PepSY domain-containing protein n=1 Tax=Oceanobacillus kapialis TaxID=481353 RepID=A0ABW5PVC5_9BACI
MMRKKAGLLIAGIAGAAVLGFGVYQTNADAKDPKLNTDEIRQMVTDQYSGTITELELDKEANRTVYEIEVTDNKIETDLEMDAETGEVLKEKSGTVNRDDDDHDDYDGSHDDAQDDNVVQVNNKDLITEKEAIAIAKKEFNGKAREVEMDEDDGRVLYEIEIVKDRTEADFEIDAVSGEILEMDIDTEDDDD